jgi:CHAT domain-containing protein
LLTTSEIVNLKLNADLVILSACNTAAGQDLHADSLSGLARAFFFAGTRSLLVSHWPVFSDVAARLVTAAVRIVEESGGKLGYAEALAKATNALLDDTSLPDNSHPSVWAPFVLVGTG